MIFMQDFMILILKSFIIEFLSHFLFILLRNLLLLVVFFFFFFLRHNTLKFQIYQIHLPICTITITIYLPILQKPKMFTVYQSSCAG